MRKDDERGFSLTEGVQRHVEGEKAPFSAFITDKKGVGIPTPFIISRFFNIIKRINSAYAVASLDSYLKVEVGTC